MRPEVHPSKEEETGLPAFESFNLDPNILAALNKLGFTTATPIQAATLPHCIAGRDLLGQAQTGTGKTAAFLIAILQQFTLIPPPTPRYRGEPRALIIAPTRELALQIAKDAEDLTRFSDIHTVTLVGGMDFEKQKRALAKGYTDILVATPGRLLDFVRQKEVHLDLVETLVIDEADRMLDLGFIPQIRQILRPMPNRGDRQTLMFSATFTWDVLELASQWMWEPEQIRIGNEKPANENVDQKIYIVTNQEKYPVMKKLIELHQDKGPIIIFANRRDLVRKVFERLKKDGLSVGHISGEVPQNKRLSVLKQFKENKIGILVATDVAGRGLHIEGLHLVINYTLPEAPDDYVHRIGRTGRAGQKGVSVSFASEDDAFLIPAIEEMLDRKLPCEPLPDELVSPR
jgi:ATP-dependent RNA helicase RhlB